MGNPLYIDSESDEPQNSYAGALLQPSTPSLKIAPRYRSWDSVYNPSGSRRVKPDDLSAEFSRDESVIDPNSAGVFIRQVERLDAINELLPGSCFPAFSDLIALKIENIDEEFTYTEMKVMEDDDQAIRELERFAEIKEGQRSVGSEIFKAIDDHIDAILRKKVVLLLQANGLDMDESGNMVDYEHLRNLVDEEPLRNSPTDSLVTVTDNETPPLSPYIDVD